MLLPNLYWFLYSARIHRNREAIVAFILIQFTMMQQGIDPDPDLWP